MQLDECVLCRLYNKKNNWAKMQQCKKQTLAPAKTTDSFDTNEDDDSRSDSLWTTDSEFECDKSAMTDPGLQAATSGGTGGVVPVVEEVKEEDDWFMDLNLDDFQSNMAAIGFGPASVISISNQDYYNQSSLIGSFSSKNQFYW